MSTKERHIFTSTFHIRFRGLTSGSSVSASSVLCSSPGGDGFSVYPGADGPLCSVRLKVFLMALQDQRALELLESRSGREAALECLGAGRGMTLSDSPRTADYLPQMRERVNAAIAAGL